MKCPSCGGEMLPGGLVSDGTWIIWRPAEKFKNSWRPAYDGLRLGRTNYLLRETRVPGAYYCESCNKVIGIFNVKEN